MIHLQGNWFDGKTSVHQRVTLGVDDNADVRVNNASGECLSQVNFAQLRIASRVGSTPRYVYFPNGEKLETQDHAQVDALLQRFRPSLRNTLAHKLESYWQFVAVTLVLVGAITWWGLVYGLPMSARWLADALPQSVMNRASSETLAILDRTHFVPSQLDDATRERVLAHFAPAIEENQHLHIRVLFRGGGDIGANAFALPDGTVVFTDEIVQLAHNDDELLAVLAHEIGHVKYRHGLRATIQGAVLSFAVGILVGDVTAAAELLIALPMILTTSAYSRDFEREADANSLHFLDSHEVPRHSFIDLMERLTYSAHCTALIAAEQEKQEKEKRAQNIDATLGAGKKTADAEKGISAERRALCDKLIAENKNNKLKVIDYFSSHPATEERVKIFREQ